MKNTLICPMAVVVLMAMDASEALEAPTDVETDNIPVVLDDHHSDTYQWIEIEGFSLQVRYPEEMDVEMADDYTLTLELVGRQLRRAVGVLPDAAVAKLLPSIRIFLKDDCTDDGAIYYWREEGDDLGWVILHCFSFLVGALGDAYYTHEGPTGENVWGNHGLILHELAHAFHDIHVEDGFDNEMIEDFYDHAVSCLGNEDTSDPYYWETDAGEFFADFSVMYYLSHWDPPHHIHNMAAKYRRLIARVWNEVGYENYEDELVSC